MFHRLYPSLIGFVAGRSDGVAGITDAGSFRSAPLEAKAEARDHLFDHISLVDEFIEESPGEFREKELGHVALWKHFVRGRFIVERDLKAYTVFLAGEGPSRAYGVLGLTTEIVDMLRFGTPMLISAVLLPWKGQIICDGLIAPYNIMIGGGMKRGFRDAYRDAKAKGIITSLDPDWRPEPPKPAQRPKSPAITRFLKKCPKTVAEFKLKYGKPRIDMGEEAAREYSVWKVDGTPVLDIDYVMVYANIVRH